MARRPHESAGAIAQPLGALAYAAISFLALAVALFVGWYLLSRPDLSAGGLANSQSYFVLLLILGLSAAAFLFGVLRSAARLSGNPMGYAVDLGGPIVAAVIVVGGGYYFTRQPEEFSLYVRLKSSAPITDSAGTTIAIDFDTRQDRQNFTNTGQAVFAAIATRYKGQKVSVQFASQTYRLIDPKGEYKIPENGVIVLEVKKLADVQEASDVCEGSPVVQLRTFGWSTFEKHNFDAAERIANSLKKCNVKDFMAYNLLGSIAFFRQAYDFAVDQFTKSVELAPANMPDLRNNLGDALVELALHSPDDLRKQRLTKAVTAYLGGDQKSEALNYKLARALLFSGEIDPALQHIKNVSTNYDYDGGIGKARILEGLIYIQSIKSSPDRSEQLLAMAKSVFLQGYGCDVSFWKAIFVESKINLPEPYDEIRKMYGKNATEWIIK